MVKLEVYREDALTVGQLKQALASIPDDVVVGQSIMAMTGYVTKCDRVLYDSALKILSLDADKRAGSFTEDELVGEGFSTLAEVP